MARPADILVLAIVCALCAAVPSAAQNDRLVRTPTLAEWSNLAKLPDFSGVWTPDRAAQDNADPIPWTKAAAKQIDQMAADDLAGKPRLLFQGCLPPGMPSWMLIPHNAMEILPTPGRITLLGETDGNRLRRIYTDGRAHPDDPDLSFFGHSVGHWEGRTLVVDTVGVLPQTFIAETESVGIPNDGGMRIGERIALAGADTLQDELTITAPKVLTRPYKTTRIWHRQRKEAFGIAEGVCQQGSFREAKDKFGNDIFKPVEFDAFGTPIAPKDPTP